MTPPLPERPPLVLDACGVLNLAAAMPVSEAEAQLSRRLIVVALAASEVLFLDDEVDGVVVRTRVDLDGLAVVDLAPAELQTYVELAVDLDDGEAASIAAAQSRGWPVWTDDRKAIRLASEMQPAVAVVSTTEVLRSWADDRGLTDAEVGSALQRVERQAAFVPPRSDPNATWWLRCIRATEQDR